jgi:hypothetical protein
LTHKYWKYDMTTSSVMNGYPHAYGNTSFWSGVPADVDAAISHWSDGQSVFFFKGSQFWKYDIIAAALYPGYPKLFGKSTGNFEGVPSGLSTGFSRCGLAGPPQFGASCEGT